MRFLARLISVPNDQLPDLVESVIAQLLAKEENVENICYIVLTVHPDKKTTEFFN